MNRTLFIFSIITVLLMSACDTREKQLNNITELSMEMDSILKTNPVLTVEQRLKGENMVDKYKSFASKYPDDSLSPQFLMRSALLYHLMPEYKLELLTLDEIVAKYPESEYAPQALATAARVCEENINDLSCSKEYLGKIKEKYPESPYAINIDLQIEYAGDADGLLNAIMAKRGISIDSALIPTDSIDTVKK